MKSFLRLCGRWFRVRAAPSPRAAVSMLVLLTVAAAVVIGLLRLRTDTGAQSFLPAGDPALRTMEDAARSFGGDPIVVLLESAQPRQLLGSEDLPKLLRLEGQLSRQPDVATVYGPATVLNQIARSAKDLMASLSGARDRTRIDAQAQAQAAGKPPQETKAAGDAAVGLFDQRYASLLVQALPAGLPTLGNSAFVNRVIFGAGEQPQPQWQFVVPSEYAVVILVRPREDLDQSGTERLVAAVRTAAQRSGIATQRLTVSGSPAVAASLGDQVRREMLLLGGLAIGLIGLCYQWVPWHRRKRYRLVPLAATLSATILVLAGFGWLGHPVSLGVVAFLPILIGIGSDFPAYLVQRTHLRRTLVAATASAAGFASLAVSPLPFVRDLGLSLAAGVLLATGVALGLRRLVPEPDAEPGVPHTEPAVAPPRSRRIGVLVVLAAIAAGGWFALSSLRIEASPERLAAGLPAMNDIEHAEQIIDTSGQIQVVLSGPNVLTTQALAWSRRAEQAVVVTQGDQLRPVISLPDLLRFLGPSPTQEEIDAGVALLPDYLVDAVVRPDFQRSVLNFGLKLQGLDQQRQLVDKLSQVLPPPPAGYRVEVAGLPIAAARAYTLVSREDYLTNLLGIAAAGLVLLIGLSRRRDAVRAITAAILATGWGLALAWLLEISLTPLTVALGSLTTVTACEFTVLLTEQRRYHSPRLGRTVAVAAIAAGCGYLALTASGLSIIRQFGLLLAASVLLSFLAAHAVVRLLPVEEPRSDEQTETPGGPGPAKEGVLT